MATTIHLVSHTHWDREWYLTFQQFRLKLVNLIDNLLDLLAEDPNFRYFMLDGQTIVLDDYLQIRPEREQELCEHIRNGRLLIGPWHILPDEFLVSPEAIIRNLLQGERTSRRFGSKMKVGYIPDTFGHIGQMPQILQGFGLQTASLQRGLSDQPCEFWWQSPDGSRVFMAYLRDGYGNAALLPAADPQTFTAEVERLAGSLEPYSSSGHVLLMHGTDHTQPPPQTSQAVAYAQGHLQGAQLIHDTLPNALAAMQQALQEQGKALITVEGELRECKRHHLLPGVLSTRMWIKQRNHACETLLEKWAEPFSTFAGIFAAQAEPSQASLSQIPGGREGMQERRLRHPEPILRYAWRVLLECQPHDSICGTSIDAVHEEMRSRFDQVKQIGEEIIRQSLESLAENIRTESPFPAAMSAIVVFNPLQDDRSEPVELSIPLASGSTEYEIVDEEGQRAPSQFGEIEENELAYLVLNREELMALLGGVQDGKLNNLGPVQDMSIQDVRFKRQNSVQFIYAVLSERGDPNQEALAQGMMEIMQAFGDPTVEKFILQVSVRSIRIRFLARQAPGLGYRSFWVRSPETPTQAAEDQISPEAGREGHTSGVHSDDSIANAFFRVQVSPTDGSLRLTDRRTGIVYDRLNYFTDGGDCGDVYNTCPPEQDWIVERVEVEEIRIEKDDLRQSITVALKMLVPARLAESRMERSAQLAEMRILTTATLWAEVPRLDFHTRVENPAEDHRLRVHFQAPISVSSADYDGHFEIVCRPLGIPEFNDSWVEQPRPEKPQRNFTDVHDEKTGLLLANRGLPEVEVRSLPEGGSEFALTLLRCVGWLSRDDFPTRKGHAGPRLPTPGAQMIGSHVFAYALIPYASGPGQPSARSQAEAFNAPLRGVAVGLHAGDLPPAAHLLRCSPASFRISAIKSAEDGAGWIVRGYNTGADPLQATLWSWKPFSKVERTNLAEKPLETLSLQANGTVSFPVGGHQIVTLKFSSEQEGASQSS